MEAEQPAAGESGEAAAAAEQQGEGGADGGEAPMES